MDGFNQTLASVSGSYFLVSAPCGSSAPLQVVPGLRSAAPRPWPVGSRVCQQQGSGRKPKYLKNREQKDLEASQWARLRRKAQGFQRREKLLPSFWRRGLVSSQELPSWSLQLKWRDLEKFGLPSGMQKRHRTKTKAMLSFWPDARLCCRWGSPCDTSLAQVPSKSKASRSWVILSRLLVPWWSSGGSHVWKSAFWQMPVW